MHLRCLPAKYIKSVQQTVHIYMLFCVYIYIYIYKCYFVFISAGGKSEMIAKKIKKMKDNKSPRVDGIPPKLLKEIVEQISTPLAKLFNLSLEEGIVPSEWKEANITPLFKKGSRNKQENYRPVSLTSVVCKLLETLIRDHMVEFLVKHNVINTSQHGFLKARSCLTNLLCFLKKLQSG